MCRCRREATSWSPQICRSFRAPETRTSTGRWTRESVRPSLILAVRAQNDPLSDRRPRPALSRSCDRSRIYSRHGRYCALRARSSPPPPSHVLLRTASRYFLEHFPVCVGVAISLNLAAMSANIMDEEESQALLPSTSENLASIKVFPLIPSLKRDVVVSLATVWPALQTPHAAYCA